MSAIQNYHVVQLSMGMHVCVCVSKCVCGVVGVV
jgi:hypothetical protein